MSLIDIASDQEAQITFSMRELETAGLSLRIMRSGVTLSGASLK